MPLDLERGTERLSALLDLLPEPAPTDRATFVMALDERPIASTGPHGEHLHWFANAGLPALANEAPRQ